MTGPVQTPEPPYYAVIFVSEHADDDAGYAVTAARMDELVRGMDGFLGYDHAGEGFGITVSYWRDLAAIARWRAQAEHMMAQRAGKERWYARYSLRVARVERQSFYAKPPAA
jgi:heme-degrading monooxygenase HmoA